MQVQLLSFGPYPSNKWLFGVMFVDVLSVYKTTIPTGSRFRIESCTVCLRSSELCFRSEQPSLPAINLLGYLILLCGNLLEFDIVEA